MLILAGLGNPGAKYSGNRHNIGFMAVDALHRHYAFGPWRKKFQGECADGEIAGEKCLLIKPQTFMNNSGQSVGEAANFFKLKPAQVVVFYDELDLAPGRFRMKTGGGAAGHNGIRSMIASSVGPEFRRARMGIGHPGDKSLVHGYVLSDFAKSEAEWVEGLCRAIATAAPFLIRGEDDAYQNEVLRLAPAAKGPPRGEREP